MNRMSPKKEFLLAGAVFLIVALIFHWQSTPHSAHGPLPENADVSDMFFSAWVIDWDTEALLQLKRPLFNAPIFAPHRDTLAYSEHMMGLALLALPVTLVSGESLISVQVVLVISTVLTGWMVYMLIRALGGTMTGAALGGIIASLAPLRLLHAPSHPHVLVLWWIPFCLWCLHRAYETRTAKWFWFLGAGIVAQGLFSMHGLFFLLIALGCAGIIYGIGHERRMQWWSMVGGTILGALLLLIPLLAPYIRLSRDPQFTRPPTEQFAFAASLQDFFTPPSFSSAAALEHQIGPGLTPLALLLFLAGAACVTQRRQRAASMRRLLPSRLLAAYGLMGLAGLLLALGPQMHLTPHSSAALPGPLWLLGALPGFSGIRAIGRFAHLTLVSIAVMTGLLWDYGMALVRQPWRGRVTILIAALLCAEFFATAPRAFAIDPALTAPRPLDDWLARQGTSCVVAELPLDDVRTVNNESARFMYLARFHHKRLVNGYSGFFPKGYHALEQITFSEHATDALPLLAELGADILVLHPTSYPDEYRTQVLEEFRADPRVEAVTSFPDSYVFRLSREGGIECL